MMSGMFKNLNFDTSTLLKIRWKQLYRTIFQLGVIYNVLIFAIVLFVVLVLYKNLADINNAYIISFCWILLFFIIMI